MDQLEVQIARWRGFVASSATITSHDADELEAHLRDEIAELEPTGLTQDEAFLIAVGRMGNVHDLSREYAREHSGRLWKQLVVAGADDQVDAGTQWAEPVLFAVAAAVTFQLARLLSGFPDGEPTWLLRNASLLVLPFLAGWLARRRRLSMRQSLPLVVAFVAAALVVNLSPWVEPGATELLVALHLPVAMWFVVGHPYSGGSVRSHNGRMDFIRFTGEWLIYSALIALGGGVLTGLTVAILEGIGVDAETLVTTVVPSGAAGAVVVAAWLVESKQRVTENMAPVLTMIFTPLFAVMLVVAAVLYAATGLGRGFDRDLLVVLDAIMVVVLGLVLYGMSARDSSRGPGGMDWIQLVAVVSALVMDLMVLGSMLARIGELGFTPNRVAAVGLNLVLLVNLVGAAWLSARFLAGRTTVHRLERWQTAYLPVFALWSAAVVVVLPPLFAFA